VAASRSAGRAHSGPDKVRAVRSSEQLEAVSYTLPRQSPVGSGENESLPNDSLSDISVLDMEVEQNVNQFEAQNPVKNREVVNQPMNYGQREVSHSVVSMDVCSEGSLCPEVASAQQPVGRVCPDLTAVNEVSEVSHNPSSRSTLPITGERRSPNSAKCTAIEARRRLESMISEVRGQTGSQLSTFSPVEFESTPISTNPRRGRMEVKLYRKLFSPGRAMCTAG